MRLLFLGVIAAAVYYFIIPRYFPDLFLSADSAYQNVKIGDTTFKLEKATTEAEREKGLSGRDSISNNSGMIFYFDKPDKHGIWMKNMKFPLDIAWLKAKQVVHFVENAQPVTTSTPPVYYPSSPADTVIEVKAGTLSQMGLNTCDKLSF